jgi:hypothetical protein
VLASSPQVVCPRLFACRALVERGRFWRDSFMMRWLLDIRLVKLRKQEGLARDKMPTMILFETRSLLLYWVMRGGIGFLGDFGAE